MAITSIGYDGTVDETAWTKLMGRAAQSLYGVLGAGDWKVTAHPTLDRGVMIATGVGWGHGVHDTSDSTVNLQGATISTGIRWDMVVARRNWVGTGGATTFTLITGTSVKQLPSRTTNPGVLDEQPIALVQFSAGSTAPTTIVDLRCWPGSGGGMAAVDLLVRNYLIGIGTRIAINGEDWAYTINTAGNLEWKRQGAMQTIQLHGTGGGIWGTAPSPATTSYMAQGGSLVATADGAGYVRLNFPTPFPNGLLTVILTNGDSSADRAFGHVVVLTPAGSPRDAGDKNGVTYSVAVEDSAGTERTYMCAGLTHRCNWFAVGW